MTEIDPKIEEDIFKYIKDNLDDLIINKYSDSSNTKFKPGVAQYDLIDEFDFLSANQIRDYLVDLEKKGKLKVTKEINPKLRFYLPKED